MRRALWASVVIGVIIALDLVLANFLVAVPTAQAISSVEHSASFQGIVGNGTYQYQGYTGSPAWHSHARSASRPNQLSSTGVNPLATMPQEWGP